MTMVLGLKKIYHCFMDIQALENAFATYLRNNIHSDDGSHDLGHFRRVWHTCQRIDASEGSRGDLYVLLAASYFHDIVSVPKNHPDRSRASVLSGERTASLLASSFPMFPLDKIPFVRHAIEAHSFSAGITPETYEARVLQDADRMEALGAIGIARTFYTAGFMRSGMFHEEDPLGLSRPLDDARFALDHFALKLLRLPETMQTEAGREMARRKAELLAGFREQLVKEVLGED
ncbi:MAG TPA: HD domain-containing protein [Dinghuibacter sp.]|uniref:HD domain-containing protein n=1 Tax=Dinghuibacter sp. TaxID=2024697 RepID=UPI002C05F701|nr:HD domain-containing protein [Dinghuibacter sp.]HTJ14011.1 HD domain-containing protein [Dinghuibacter sp.]